MFNRLYKTIKQNAVIFSSVILFSCPTLAQAGEAKSADTQEKPNVIYIIVDDLGIGDIEPYGQQKIRTPNLQKLANEGLTFTQHYAGNTVCAPSRAALMTGLHSGNNQK